MNEMVVDRECDTRLVFSKRSREEEAMRKKVQKMMQLVQDNRTQMFESDY